MTDALDAFFDHYYRRRPVNATFTGVHAYDGALPDWSPAGLETLGGEMQTLGSDLAAAYPTPPTARGYREDTRLLDAELAGGFLATQRAELTGAHGPRGNPALWTGEAVFSIVSLMTRDFAPVVDRMRSAAARLRAIPPFLADAATALGARPVPGSWSARALRDCQGAARLLGRGVDRWLAAHSHAAAAAPSLRAAADQAGGAFVLFAEWLRTRPPAPVDASACGEELFDLLLARGHHCRRPRAELLAEARDALGEARARLDAMAREHGGSWDTAQERLAADHPAPGEYLDAFARRWAECREWAVARDVVTWPDWPIRYVPFPEWTADAAPYLYYLYYRSPAPFDRYTVYDYVVPPLAPGNEEAHLRVWNRSAITLNHVVHHGAVGHHVQNWHAYHRAPSRVGQVAAVDCANRIGMFCGGTMAEGWACYATGLMEELGFLSPLERLSEQHSRVRFLARAVIDVELHQGTMASDSAVRFWAEQTGAGVDAGRAEVTKASMFPGTAIVYWLGTRSIFDLRDEIRARDGARFSLKAFHDELLGHGSIPVPLIARMMTEDVA